MKIAFKTLGCRLNQYETDSLVTNFVNKGYEVVEASEKADAYIVNTCTITNSGDKKSRQELNRILRENPSAVIVATGCMATNYKKELNKQNKYTYIVDNDHKTSIFHLVDSHLSGEIMEVDSLPKDRFSYPAVEHGFHTRSMIKIQDGCDNFCSYCIVPFVRGRAISRKPEEVLENIRKVVEYGYKEVVITGVNIGRYQYEDSNFEDLMEQILNLDGDFRVRISSIEPEGYGQRLFELFKHPKLMPHIHMCLQSGSDTILKAMNRNYDVAQFEKMVKDIRILYPDFNFTTDIIVGFPGETDKEFQESLEAADRSRFSHIHTFKYSNRTGTRAAKMKAQVNGKIMTERSEKIRLISEKHKQIYRSSFIGKETRVLVEKIEKGIASGYSEHYVPVQFASSSLIKQNEFYTVMVNGIEECEDPNLLAKLKSH